MARFRLMPFAPLLLLLTACSSTSGPAPRSTNEDEAAIRKVDQQFASAMGSKNSAELMGLLAPDAVVLTSKRLTTNDANLKDAVPAENAVAIRSLNEEFFRSTPGLSVSAKPRKIIVSEAGDLAYDIGDFEMSFDGPNGRMIDRGRYLFIMTKLNGQWRIVVHGGTAGTWELLDSVASTSSTRPAALQASARRSAEPVSGYEAYSAPTDHHRQLDALAGNWKLIGSRWSGPTEKPVETFMGTATTAWTLGGRFLESEINCHFGGNPIQGKRIDGYDSGANEFTSIWMDSKDTFAVDYRGTCDDNCTVRTMRGEFTDPVTREHVVNREVTTIVDVNTVKFESYVQDGARPEFKNLEITYKRQ